MMFSFLKFKEPLDIKKETIKSTSTDDSVTFQHTDKLRDGENFCVKIKSHSKNCTQSSNITIKSLFPATEYHITTTREVQMKNGPHLISKSHSWSIKTSTKIFIDIQKLDKVPFQNLSYHMPT